MTGCVPTLEKEFDSQINESSSGSSVSKRDSRGSSQRSIKTEEESATLAGKLINDNCVVLCSGQAQMFLTAHTGIDKYKYRILQIV